MFFTRRGLLYASAATVVSGAGVGLYTWLVEPHWLEVVRRPLPIRGLPSSLRGRTLAQLSDLHGGQCKPPFLPPPLLPVDNRRYTSGAFELSRDRMLYISRGIGHLLQVRINARPEVTLFELQSA